MMWCVVLCILTLARTVHAAEEPTLDYRDEAQLARLLWQRSPDLAEARANLGLAESERIRAYLYPNPSLDLNWGTVPLGRTNPPGLDRWSQVPNYSATLSELVAMGKRGARQRATTWEREQARLQAQAVLGERFFSLLETLGTLATNQQRLAVLAEQIEDATELLELNRARATRGEIAALDVDLAEVELARLVATRDRTQADLDHARAECIALLALPCPLFSSAGEAREFLQHTSMIGQLEEPWSETAQTRRPDLGALEAAERAAMERATLARLKAVPDVTLRAGYLYDQFVQAGNQRNSVNVGVELTLPVADRGQADYLAAQTQASRARQLRTTLLGSTP